MQSAMDKSHSHVITMISQSAQKRQRFVHQPAPGKPYNETTITVNGDLDSIPASCKRD